MKKLMRDYRKNLRMIMKTTKMRKNEAIHLNLKKFNMNSLLISTICFISFFFFFVFILVEHPKLTYYITNEIELINIKKLFLVIINYFVQLFIYQTVFKVNFLKDF